MAEEKKPGIPRSVRITDETFEKFKALNEEIGGQSATLDLLLDVYYQSTTKTCLADIDAQAVSDFQLHIHALNNAFTLMLEKLSECQKTARLEVKNQLERYETLLSESEKENANFKKYVSETKAENEKLADMVSGYETRNKKLHEENQNLKKAVDDMKSDYELSIKQNKADYEERINKIKSDFDEKLLDKDSLNKILADTLENERKKTTLFEEKENENKTLNDENKALKMKISSLELSIGENETKNKVERDILQVELKQKHSNELVKVRNSYDTEIKGLKKQYNETEKLFKAEIADYQLKYKQLLEQYQNLVSEKANKK